MMGALLKNNKKHIVSNNKSPLRTAVSGSKINLNPVIRTKSEIDAIRIKAYSYYI